MAEGNSHNTWSQDQTTSNQFMSSFSFFSNPNGHPSRILSGISGQNVTRGPGPLTLGRAHAEGSRLIRNNINTVINELGPLMHHARSAETHGLNIGSWLRRPQQPEPIGNPTVPENSTVINLESGPSSSSTHDITSQQPTRLNSSRISINISPPVTSTPAGAGTSHSDNLLNEHTDHHNHQQQSPEDAAVEALRQSPEAQSIVLMFHKYVPFVLILFGKALYDHRAGILIFLGLFVTFIHANSVVKREISKQARRSLVSLLFLFVNLLVCICFIYYVFQDQRLYKSLVFIPPYTQPLSLWDLLWIVGITDFVLKLITIQVKIGMACFPGWIIPYASRGKWYLMVESTSQLYRGLASIQPWLYYLLESYQGAEKVIGVFLSAAYMVSKGADLMFKVKLFRRAFWKLIQNVSLGVSPSKEQLDTAGSQCPICHDEYDTPVLLHCRHVFCEACVTTWFDREQTCPLCRAKVVDDPSWRDGATSLFVQLF